jgi:hypothetical protein
MNKNSSHNFEGWRTQFSRTCRWQARVQEIRAECGRVGVRQDFEDYLYSFFQNCFHLREWLSKSGAVSDSELKRLFASHTELQLCRDICNGTKHMTISKPSIDADFYTFREYDWFHIPSPADTPYAAENFMIRAAGRKQDMFELADRCMEIWHEFLGAHGLRVTADADISAHE